MKVLTQILRSGKTESGIADESQISQNTEIKSKSGNSFSHLLMNFLGMGTSGESESEELSQGIKDKSGEQKTDDHKHKSLTAAGFAMISFPGSNIDPKTTGSAPSDTAPATTEQKGQKIKPAPIDTGTHPSASNGEGISADKIPGKTTGENSIGQATSLIAQNRPSEGQVSTDGEQKITAPSSSTTDGKSYGESSQTVSQNNNARSTSKPVIENQAPQYTTQADIKKENEGPTLVKGAFSPEKSHSGSQSQDKTELPKEGTDKSDEKLQIKPLDPKKHNKTKTQKTDSRTDTPANKQHSQSDRPDAVKLKSLQKADQQDIEGNGQKQDPLVKNTDNTNRTISAKITSDFHRGAAYRPRPSTFSLIEKPSFQSTGDPSSPIFQMDPSTISNAEDSGKPEMDFQTGGQNKGGLNDGHTPLQQPEGRAVQQLNSVHGRREFSSQLIRQLQQFQQDKASTNTQNWKHHRFMLDDGQSVNIAARHADGALQLQLSTGNTELNKIIQQHINEIRQHLSEQLNIDVNLHFQQFGGQQADQQAQERAVFDDQLFGNEASNVSKAGEPTTAAAHTIRYLGFNNNEWTA